MSDVLRPTETEALAAWAERVGAEAAQVTRLRESPVRPDHYGPIAHLFRADPDRKEETLDQLLAMVEPGETWLDIGAGGGRYTIPLARRAGRVIAAEPSEGMREVLAAGIAEHDVANIEVRNLRWPTADPPAVDVAFMSHVGYDIEEIGPFLDAMERAARRLCVVVLLERQPAAAGLGPIWEQVHGEPKVFLPALPEFLVLQVARGRVCNVRLSSRVDFGFAMDDFEAAHRFIRGRLWLDEGTDKDRKLAELLPGFLVERDGAWHRPDTEGVVGIVSWQPPV